MRRTMLKSKIHRATVTDSDLNYVGSITVDTELLEAADIREHELVHVLDIDNGTRFETYTIAGPRGSGGVQVNGAAARLVHTGDKVIVVSYASYEEAELESYEARVVHVDADNRIVGVDDDANGSTSMPSPSADDNAKDSASMPNPSRAALQELVP